MVWPSWPHLPSGESWKLYLWRLQQRSLFAGELWHCSAQLFGSTRKQLKQLSMAAKDFIIKCQTQQVRCPFLQWSISCRDYSPPNRWTFGVVILVLQFWFSHPATTLLHFWKYKTTRLRNFLILGLLAVALLHGENGGLLFKPFKWLKSIVETWNLERSHKTKCYDCYDSWLLKYCKPVKPGNVRSTMIRSRLLTSVSLWEVPSIHRPKVITFGLVCPAPGFP